MDKPNINDKVPKPPTTADASAFVRAGQALSKPGETGSLNHANVGILDSGRTLAQFTPSDHLLKGLDQQNLVKAAESTMVPNFH